MENKLPDDHLEDFLRNSFKNYSAKPSEEVWDKIDYTLDAQKGIKLPSRKKWLWTLTAAAVAGMMIYLTASNIYLNSKLRKVISEYRSNTQLVQNRRPESNPSVMPGIDAPSSESVTKPEIEKASPGNDINKAIATPPVTINRDRITKSPLPATESKSNIIPQSDVSDWSGHAAEAQGLSPNKVARDRETSVTKISKANSTREFAGNTAINQLHTNSTKNTVRSEIKNTRLTKIGKVNTETEFTSQDLESKQSRPSDSFDTPNASGNSDLSISSKMQRDAINLISLPVRNGAIATVSGTNTIKATSLFPDMIPAVSSKNKRWSEWNVFGGLIYESGSITEQVNYKGATFTKPTNTFATTKSWFSGVGYSTSLNQNWFVTSGIGYKYYKLVNNVNQNVGFGDRIHSLPGSMPTQHDWDYKLHCAGGSSEITIQSEQLDSRATISDNEQVGVHITNYEELGYIAIPLSLNYRTSSGKFAFTAGAGVHMNILADVNFESPSININHPQLVARKEHREFHFDKSSPVVWNSVLSAGLLYSIGPRLRLQLNPSLYIPLTSRSSDHDVKINSSSFGVQVGLNYSIASL